MKKSLIGLLLSIFFLGVVSVACTHKPYHPNKTDRQWAVDHEECEKSVRAGVRDEPYAYDMYDEMRLIKRCMKEKGWRWKRANWFRPKEEPKP